MEILLPKQIEYCIETIEKHGFEAWCVGGAVRDHLMNVTPGDYDVTTNALPEDIISMFPKTAPTGLKHGTVTVIIDKTPIEVTTYRTEDGYSDHRKPESVHFINRVDGDLERRDFTMNAICYHPVRGIYDPLGGLNDINNKIIRAVGEPERRFKEDALRIMRAFRFSCQLGFDIEENTLTAALKCAETLKFISAERIAAELKKTLTAYAPEKISPLTESGTLDLFGLPAISIPEALKYAQCDFSFRFALLCNQFRLDSTSCLKKLKFDNATQKSTAVYRELLGMPYETSADIKRLLRLGGPEQTQVLLNYSDPSKIKLLNCIIEKKEPYCISMLDISGDDLIHIGITGSDISRTLNYLLETVIEQPKLNNKTSLLELAKTV